jgi:hypothetical protein
MDSLAVQLASLVAQLREVAPNVWGAAMRQIIIDAVSNLLWLLPIAALVVIGVILLRQANKKFYFESIYTKGKMEWRWEDDDRGSKLAGGWTCLFLGLTFVVLQVVLTLPRLLNTEWFAIQLLLHQVK